MTESAHGNIQASFEALSASFSGRVGMAYHVFGTNETRVLGDATRMSAASLIKLPILLTALRNVSNGELDLDARYALTTTAQVPGAGILQFLQAGAQLTLLDYLTLMMIVSDNTATNIVIDLLGINSINAFCVQHKLHDTVLVGKLQLPVHQQTPAQQRGARNQTSVHDILNLLINLQRGNLLPKAQTTRAFHILKQQQFTEALARYLPTDTELELSAVSVASKSGCLQGVWHDAGVVFDASGKALFALVVMTERSTDRSFSWEQEGMILIARLSRSVFDALR